MDVTKLTVQYMEMANEGEEQPKIMSRMKKSKIRKKQTLKQQRTEAEAAAAFLDRARHSEEHRSDSASMTHV